MESGLHIAPIHRTSALGSLLAANVNIKIAGLDVHHPAVYVVQ